MSSAAALLQDGRLVAAAEEERFSRVKHDYGFPTHAINFCLRQGGIDITFRIVKDLSHTYPRDENDGILRWFDPGLAAKG
jgi:predicted NodU family carbamoyl transferase